MLKKYMITIEEPQSYRYNDFFNRNGFLPTEFSIYGVKGKDAPIQDYFMRAVLGASLPLTPSEFGCKESHIQCLADFIKSEADYALILEDDVVKKENIDFDFDFSVLGENFVFYIGDMQNKKTKKFRVRKISEKFSDQPIGRLPSCFLTSLYGTYAYIVDRKSAEKYLNFLKKPYVADDWFKFFDNYWDVKFYVADCFRHPQVIDTDYFSVIEDERLKRKFFLKGTGEFSNFWLRKKIKILRLVLSIWMKKYK